MFFCVLKNVVPFGHNEFRALPAAKVNLRLTTWSQMVTERAATTIVSECVRIGHHGRQKPFAQLQGWRHSYSSANLGQWQLKKTH